MTQATKIITKQLMKGGKTAAIELLKSEVNLLIKDLEGKYRFFVPNNFEVQDRLNALKTNKDKTVENLDKKFSKSLEELKTKSQEAINAVQENYQKMMEQNQINYRWERLLIMRGFIKSELDIINEYRTNKKTFRK